MAAKRRQRKSTANGLIQSYGVYWKKEDVAWDGKRIRGLWGNRNLKQKREADVNFWEQAGVYVLYNAVFEPIYSGQATSLGRRLLAHTRNRWLGPKWQFFSWYGVRRLKGKGGGLRKLNQRYAATAPIILDTLEAVLIAVGARTENKQGPKLHGAIAFHQVRKSAT